MLNLTFQGRGWKFPPQFVKEGCEALMVADEADIRESLIILLSTRLRERVIQSGYGCSLDALLFESVTFTFLSEVKDMIRTAIILYEARIDLIDITMDTSAINDGLIKIVVEYYVRATNARNNIVYPFYLNEGTNVDVGSKPANY